MEVREGIEQKNGAVQKDWKLIPLGELFVFKNGLNKEKRFFGFGIPIVNYMDVFQKRGLNIRDVKGRVSLTPNEIKNYAVKKGDVFFTRTSETVEEIGISSVLLEDIKDTVFSGFVLRARPKNETIVDEFKKYCFSSKDVRNQISATSSYTTRALTNGRLLSNVKVFIPKSQSEQTAIATALSDADALIQSLEKLIAKKQSIKQGAMQLLLTGKQRLPGFSGEWEVKKLGEIVEVYQLGGNYQNTEEQTGYPLIKMGNLSRGNIVLNKIEFVTSRNKPDKKDRLKYGDVLFNTRNTLDLVGKIAVWKNELPVAYFNSNILRFKFNNRYVASNFYMNYSLNSDSCITQLRNIATGTTSVAAIYTRDLKEVTVLLAPLKEQVAISQVILDMERELNTLNQKLSKYRQIKQGMMQELLTGKTRLL